MFSTAFVHRPSSGRMSGATLYVETAFRRTEHRRPAATAMTTPHREPHRTVRGLPTPYGSRLTVHGSRNTPHETRSFRASARRAYPPQSSKARHAKRTQSRRSLLASTTQPISGPTDQRFPKHEVVQASAPALSEQKPRRTQFIRVHPHSSVVHGSGSRFNGSRLNDRTKQTQLPRSPLESCGCKRIQASASPFSDRKEKRTQSRRTPVASTRSADLAFEIRGLSSPTVHGSRLTNEQPNKANRSGLPSPPRLSVYGFTAQRQNSETTIEETPAGCTIVFAKGPRVSLQSESPHAGCLKAESFV